MKKSNLLVLAFVFGLITTAFISDASHAADSKESSSSPATTSPAITAAKVPAAPVEPESVKSDAAADIDTGSEAKTATVKDAKTTKKSETSVSESETESEPESTTTDTEATDTEITTQTTATDAASEADSVATLSDDSAATLSDDTAATESDPNFPVCEALFQTFSGTTIKFGATDDWSRGEYWAVLRVVQDAIGSDPACMSELRSAGYMYDYDVVYHDQDDSGKSGSFWSLRITTYDDSYDTSRYETKRIPITVIKDDSAERAALADRVIAELSGRDYSVTGDDIKALNAVSYDNAYLDLGSIHAFTDAIAEYGGNITLADDLYQSDFYYVEQDDTEYSRISIYRAGFFIDNYFYGYITDFTISYESERISSEDYLSTITSPTEAELPSDAVFTVTEQPKESATAVLGESDHLAGVYGFSLKAADGTPITQFPYGALIEFELASDSIDKNQPLYARYLSPDGTITETDTPVNYFYCWESMTPFGIIDTVSPEAAINCRVNFIIHHLSDYAFIQTPNPILALAPVEPDTEPTVEPTPEPEPVVSPQPTTPAHPNSGFARAEESSGSASANSSTSLVAVILASGLAAFAAVLRFCRRVTLGKFRR